MTALYRFLEENDIAYERHDHPPVYTVADVERLTPDLPGRKTKNLFLRDAKGTRHILVVVGHDKRVDLKRLGAVMGLKGLGFGSPERLNQYLGIQPGAVSLLAVFNDPASDVDLFVDSEIWDAPRFQFHPLVNTQTLVMDRPAVERFAALTRHPIRLIAVPEKT